MSMSMEEAQHMVNQERIARGEMECPVCWNEGVEEDGVPCHFCELGEEKQLNELVKEAQS